MCVGGGGLMYMHEDPFMGRRSTPSVGRLTVARVIAVGVVKSQDAWSDRSIKETPIAA